MNEPATPFTESDSERRKSIQDSCNEYASDASVYIRVFQTRAAQLNVWANAVRVLGLIIPIVVGIVAISYSAKFEHLDLVVQVGVVLALFQFVMAAIASLYGWDGKLSFYYYAIQELTRLKDDFIKHKTLGDSNTGFLYHGYALTRQQYQQLLSQIILQNVSAREIRTAKIDLSA